MKRMFSVRFRQNGCAVLRFDGAETAVGDINHSFSGLICGIFKYKQPVFRQRYKVLRTQSTTFLIRLPPFPILIYCFPILFNRSETIFPDFPTTFRHFPTQFPHFQTRIPPLPHTTTQFSWCDYLRFRHEFPVYVLGYKVLRIQSTTFKPKFPQFHTPFPNFTIPFHHFQTKISANQHTNRPFPNSDMPL